MDRLAPLYDRDFFAWTEDQAQRLRRAAGERANLEIDFENVAEEIECVGKGQRREVESLLARVLEHLLKLEFSPADRPRRGWRNSLRIHRRHARKELAESPSLEGQLSLREIFEDGRLLAEGGFIEHAEEAADLPAECPYTLDQLLDDGFFPANRHGLMDRDP